MNTAREQVRDSNLHVCECECSQYSARDLINKWWLVVVYWHLQWLFDICL